MITGREATVKVSSTLPPWPLLTQESERGIGLLSPWPLPVQESGVELLLVRNVTADEDWCSPSFSMDLERNVGSTDAVTVTAMSSDRKTLGCIGFEDIVMSPVD